MEGIRSLTIQSKIMDTTYLASLLDLNQEKTQQFLYQYLNITQHLLAENKTTMDYAVQIHKNQSISVYIRNGHVETIDNSHGQDLSVSVFDQHKTGTAHTTDISQQSIQRIIQHACQIAHHTQPDPFAGLVSKTALANPVVQLPFLTKQSFNIDFNTMIAWAKNCEKLACDDPAVDASEGLSFDFNISWQGYANSHGFMDVYPETTTSISLSVIGHDQADGMQSGQAMFVTRSAQQWPSQQTIANEAVNQLKARLNPQKVVTGNYPVIVTPSVAKQFIGALLQGISGQKQYQQATFLYQKQGQFVCPNHLSIIEDPYLPDGLGSRPYDNEGVAIRRSFIVKNGILQRYLLSSYSARQLGLETTGNAGGISNVLITSKNTMAQASMIQQISQGVMIDSVMGQGLDLNTGNYSQGASGYWIENGVIQHPIDNFTMAGNMADLLQQIDTIGSDICKNGAIQIGSLKLSQVHIAGE